MKQSITLVGCGSKQFSHNQASLERLTSFLKAGSFQQGNVAVDSSVGQGTWPYFEATNRLFTPAREQGGLSVLDIPHDWDPLSIMASLQGTELVFTDENYVDYNKACLSSDGSVE